MRAATFSKLAVGTTLAVAFIWAAVGATAREIPSGGSLPAPGLTASALGQRPDVLVPAPPPTPSGQAAQAAGEAAIHDVAAGLDVPALHNFELSGLPDLTQTDPGLDLPDGGNSYCGPVAVSNALMGLVARGYDRLAPPGRKQRNRQIDLVRALSSYRYMGTSPVGGTGPSGVLRGLSRWVGHAGYRIRRLQYQGWRHHPAAFRTGVRQPNPDFLASALKAEGVAFIHVGWYYKRQNHPGLLRRGGHWLTVERVQERGGEVWLGLRDPAPYAGMDPALEEVALQPLQEGWLFDPPVSFPARGYYRLGAGMHLKRPDDVAILDGAVVLVLEE